MKLNSHKTGLALGGFFAIWHLGWALLVALGLAQTLLDFVYSIHFLGNPFVVEAFVPTTALILILVTFVVGYVIGWVFAFIWNKLHK